MSSLLLSLTQIDIMPSEVELKASGVFYMTEFLLPKKAKFPGLVKTQNRLNDALLLTDINQSGKSKGIVIKSYRKQKNCVLFSKKKS